MGPSGGMPDLSLVLGAPATQWVGEDIAGEEAFHRLISSLDLDLDTISWFHLFLSRPKLHHYR